MAGKIACLGVLAALLVAWTATSTTAATDGKRVLAVLDNYSTKESHSVFFSFLEDNGFQIKYALADSPSLALSKYGEYLFDHVVLFCPTVEAFGGSLSEESLTQFVDEGGNVFVAANSNIGEPLREFASQVGFEYDLAGTSVIDHIHHVGDDATMVKSSNVLDVPIITGGKPSQPIVFSGVGLAADPANELAIVVLAGSSTSFSYTPSTAVSSRELDYPHAVGTNTVLVGALQARNSARVMLSGSIDMFSNEMFAKSIANEKFAKSILFWTFKERGNLRASAPKHNVVGQAEPPREYTIKEEVEYGITIEEKVDGKWVPFKGQDVQLEFVRIDPFVRTTLKNNNGRFQTRFTLPDVYGVFQFKVDYNRVGYSNIHSAVQVSVRPLLHTQYERFIPAAYPYYASAFSMMFGLFVFSLVFLHMREPAATRPKTE